jgi:hypothetical protein
MPGVVACIGPELYGRQSVSSWGTEADLGTSAGGTRMAAVEHPVIARATNSMEIVFFMD